MPKPRINNRIDKLNLLLWRSRGHPLPKVHKKDIDILLGFSLYLNLFWPD